VLLAGLERQAVGLVARGVAREADDTAGHSALVRVLAGQERGVGPAIAKGHAEALRVADDDVGAHLARRGEDCEGEKVGNEDRDHLVLLALLGDPREVGDCAVRRGVRQENSQESGVRLEVIDVADDNINAHGFSAHLAELHRRKL
jgi:hypothetical protein